MGNRKLQIIFDANPLIQNKSGVGHFAYRLLESLASEGNEINIYAYYFNFLGRKKDFILPDSSNITYTPIKLLPTKLLSLFHKLRFQLPLELFLKTKGYDFIVFPNFVSVPSIRKIPYCVAVHDMSFEDCPEYLSKGNRTYLQTFTTKSVIGANFVISISEFTKSRIKKYYGKATADKTLVIPIPYEYVKPKGDISKSIKDLASKPFLLHVGTVEPRKNISNLVKGFASTRPNIRDNYSLVLAGGRGWNDEDIINTLENTKGLADVALTGYVSDAERDYLYSKSAAVCMLSHYEGFGMPILEAFYYNKPLLLSSIDVFHEVASTQAIYCNQNDIKDISTGIAKVLDSGKPTLKTNGKSWKDNANSILTMMRKGISK